jgi:hypothetical protein
MRVWVRFDPNTEEAALEDEIGSELGTGIVEVQRDAGFYLIGPLEVEDV